jgi:hypothetical protein
MFEDYVQRTQGKHHGMRWIVLGVIVLLIVAAWLLFR